MKVKDAMHKGVDWVSPDTPVTELAKLMCEHDLGAIPIGEKDRLIGMVTDRDIVCKGLAQDGFDVASATARDVMTAGIHCCREDDDLAKAVRHMEALSIRRLPMPLARRKIKARRAQPELITMPLKRGAAKLSFALALAVLGLSHMRSGIVCSSPPHAHEAPA
jgi:predicted transcriptional regulator